MANTINALSKAVIIDNGEVLQEQAVANPCQTWKFMCKVKDTMPDTAHLKVYRTDGVTLFKDYVIKATSAGRQLVNLVTETNRGQVAKARRAAAASALNASQHQEAAMIEAGVDPETSEEVNPVIPEVPAVNAKKKSKKSKK